MMINRCLTALLLSLLLLAAPAAAQEDITEPVAPAPPAVESPPSAPAQAEKISAPGGTVVIELFSSQACVFCPQADRLFADLVTQPGVIGLACHVDYFDVKQGALSKPFCTERQSRYMDLLHAGPNYTPQMVMQGAIDVVGYKMKDVIAGLEKAGGAGTAALEIKPAGGGGFQVVLPDGVAGRGSVYLALFDKPHDLIVAEGRNKGQRMIYYNIVSAVEEPGPWPEGQAAMTVAPKLAKSHKGFAVLVQDPVSGKILAAGKHEIN